MKVGQKVKTGDILGIMGQTGNAAGGYDHCHLEARATATGIGLDPTAYSGTDNAVGIYGTKPVTEPDLTSVPNSQLSNIQLVSLAPLNDEQMRQTDALAEALGLSDSEHYQQLHLGDGYFAAVFAVSIWRAYKLAMVIFAAGSVYAPFSICSAIAVYAVLFIKILLAQVQLRLLPRR